MPDEKIYIADRIFTGEEWLTDHAIVTDGTIIKKIVPVTALSSSQQPIHLGHCILAPAFIDLQIYGAHNSLLAVFPEPASLKKLNEYCNKGGAALCLPTVATNTYEVFYQCIDAVNEYWNNKGTGILGLHLEGPWINPVKRGAHAESLVHSPKAEQVKQLLEYGKGIIKMITLAPEACSPDIIKLILSYDVIISAGHSNAIYAEAKTGFANGITTVTHLYNAMSPLQHRATGLVGATMDDDKVTASIIPDGHHVDYAALRIAKQVMKERLFVITDAVTTTGEGYYKHQLAGDKYEADGILSGSSLTMVKALQNLVQYGGIDLGEALRMCSLYPARVMRLEHIYGRITEGYKSSMVVLDEKWHVKEILN